jgi:hypothetical protein
MYDKKWCFQFKQYCISRGYICYTRICVLYPVGTLQYHSYIFVNLTRHYLLLNYSNTHIRQEAFFCKLLSKWIFRVYNETSSIHSLKVVLKCNNHQSRISVEWEHETWVLFRVKATDYFDLLHKHNTFCNRSIAGWRVEYWHHGVQYQVQVSWCFKSVRHVPVLLNPLDSNNWNSFFIDVLVAKCWDLDQPCRKGNLTFVLLAWNNVSFKLQSVIYFRQISLK